MTRVYTDPRCGIRIEFDSELFVEKATLFDGKLDISDTLIKIDKRNERVRKLPLCTPTEDSAYWNEMLETWKRQAVPA